MRNAKNHVLRYAKLAKYLIVGSRAPSKYLHKNVPYYSQWESRDLNKQILENEISAEDDPEWRSSGAATKKEYSSWSAAGCGMACTKMILASETGKVIPLLTLGKKCAEYGGYTMPLETSPGLYYKPYLTFLDKEFGLKAHISSGMNTKEIIHELGQGNYVVVSVSPHIRYPHSQPKVKSGHLVLLLGYDKTKKEIYLHNPSGISKETQEYATIPFTDFRKFFSGRGIVVNTNKAIQ